MKDAETTGDLRVLFLFRPIYAIAPSACASTKPDLRSVHICSTT